MMTYRRLDPFLFPTDTVEEALVEDGRRRESGPAPTTLL